MLYYRAGILHRQSVPKSIVVRLCGHATGTTLPKVGDAVSYSHRGIIVGLKDNRFLSTYMLGCPNGEGVCLLKQADGLSRTGSSPVPNDIFSLYIALYYRAGIGKVSLKV